MHIASSREIEVQKQKPLCKYLDLPKYGAQWNFIYMPYSYEIHSEVFSLTVGEFREIQSINNSGTSLLYTTV